MSAMLKTAGIYEGNSMQAFKRQADLVDKIAL